MSWIDLDDLVAGIEFLLKRDDLAGSVNMVAPHPVTNHEFTKALGRILGRPTLFPLPGLAARLVFGEMADEILLASTRVQPARLLAAGYSFKYAFLDKSLHHLL